MAAAALVVEDDPQIAHILRFILGREGYEVHHAADGRTAETLIATLAPPAIITLDTMLPHTDGYQLLKRIRSTPAWESVPVILLTTRSQEKDFVRGLQAGASDHIVKPFKPDELLALVKRLVKR